VAVVYELRYPLSIPLKFIYLLLIKKDLVIHNFSYLMSKF